MFKRVTINTVLASIILQSTPLCAYGSLSVSASTRTNTRPTHHVSRNSRIHNFLSGVATFFVVGAFVYIVAQGGDLRVDLAHHHACPDCGLFSFGSIRCNACTLTCPSCNIPTRNGRLCTLCNPAHQCPSCHLYSRNGRLCQTCVNRCPQCNLYSHGGRLCVACDVTNQCPSCHNYSRHGVLCQTCFDRCPRCHLYSRNGAVCNGCRNAYRHRCYGCNNHHCRGGNLCINYTIEL